MQVEGKVAASVKHDDVSRPLIHFYIKNGREHTFGNRKSEIIPLVCIPKVVGYALKKTQLLPTSQYKKNNTINISYPDFTGSQKKQRFK